MKYFRSRFNSAFTLLKSYNYPEPFALHSRAFFKANKKFGSKDRKAILELCYAYFRCGISLVNYKLEEGLLLSALQVDFTDTQYWQKHCTELGYNYKLPESFFEETNKAKRIRTFLDADLSFYPSNFVQTKFSHYNLSGNIEFRPKNWVKDHTDSEKRHLGLIGCKTIDFNANLDDNIQVQDLSSQFICSKLELESHYKVWDVCSGSGGKSINLLYGDKGDFYLSDVRPGILSNAKKRLQTMLYKAKLACIDLTKIHQSLEFESEQIIKEGFDVIIADVPCTGSGTWFRTPEHFMCFEYEALDKFVDRQKLIVRNSLPFLKKGGVFYYITCSIFTAENEEMKNWFEESFNVSVNEEIFFDGIKQKSDAMYMVSFTKS